MVGASWTVDSVWAEVGYRRETLRRYTAGPGTRQRDGLSNEAGRDRVRSAADPRSRGEGEHGEGSTEADEDLLIAC